MRSHQILPAALAALAVCAFVQAQDTVEMSGGSSGGGGGGGGGTAISDTKQTASTDSAVSSGGGGVGGSTAIPSTSNDEESSENSAIMPIYTCEPLVRVGKAIGRGQPTPDVCASHVDGLVGVLVDCGFPREVAEEAADDSEIDINADTEFKMSCYCNMDAPDCAETRETVKTNVYDQMAASLEPKCTSTCGLESQHQQFVEALLANENSLACTRIQALTAEASACECLGDEMSQGSSSGRSVSGGGVGDTDACNTVEADTVTETTSEGDDSEQIVTSVTSRLSCSDGRTVAVSETTTVTVTTKTGITTETCVETEMTDEANESRYERSNSCTVMRRAPPYEDFTLIQQCLCSPSDVSTGADGSIPCEMMTSTMRLWFASELVADDVAYNSGVAGSDDGSGSADGSRGCASTCRPLLEATAAAAAGNADEACKLSNGFPFEECDCQDAEVLALRPMVECMCDPESDRCEQMVDNVVNNERTDGDAISEDDMACNTKLAAAMQEVPCAAEVAVQMQAAQGAVDCPTQDTVCGCLTDLMESVMSAGDRCVAMAAKQIVASPTGSADLEENVCQQPVISECRMSKEMTQAVIKGSSMLEDAGIDLDGFDASPATSVKANSSTLLLLVATAAMMIV